MKIMQKIIRGWARNFFLKQIRVYGIHQHITQEMFMAMDGTKTRRHIERDMVLRMADKMYEEGMIEFEVTNNYQLGGTDVKAKIRII